MMLLMMMMLMTTAMMMMLMMMTMMIIHDASGDDCDEGLPLACKPYQGKYFCGSAFGRQCITFNFLPMEAICECLHLVDPKRRW